MRFVYSDEAGISRHEPVTIVVGVILDADTKWNDVSERIDQIRHDLVPAQRQRDYIFHATELFSGGAGFEDWADHARWMCLEQLIEIPRLHNLALSVGYCKRSTGTSDSAWKKQLELDHVYAFANCMIAVEEFMAKRAPGEVAVVVAEDNAEMRYRLRDLPEKLRRPEVPDLLRLGNSIKDIVHFCPKNGAPILQIADACSFVVRRYMARLRHGDHFFKKMTGMSTTSDRNTPGGHFVLDWNVSRAPDSSWKKMSTVKVKFSPMKLA